MSFINGNVKCWGRNDNGQVGNGSSSWPNTPIDVDLGTGFNDNVKDLTLGDYHTCATSNSGEVKCWGRNNYGQLGLGSSEHKGDETNEMGDNLGKTLLGNGKTALDMAAGFTHTCSLLNDGTVKCWGMNGFGQAANNHNETIGAEDDSLDKD